MATYFGPRRRPMVWGYPAPLTGCRNGVITTSRPKRAWARYCVCITVISTPESANPGSNRPPCPATAR